MGRTGTWFFVLACGILGAACGGDAEPEGDPLPAEATIILEASSAAMADVTSVRFDLERSGADVFIDEFESLALDKIKGRFSAPGSADAVLNVTVDGSLKTDLGAVALEGRCGCRIRSPGSSKCSTPATTSTRRRSSIPSTAGAR